MYTRSVRCVKVGLVLLVQARLYRLILLSLTVFVDVFCEYATCRRTLCPLDHTVSFSGVWYGTV